MVDPGFGFGKTVQHNYSLLQHLDVLSDLGCPILVGVSRKSMIHRVLNCTSEEALNGTTALHAWALDRAHIGSACTMLPRQSKSIRLHQYLRASVRHHD